MFGTNVIAGRSSFKDKSSLLVTSVFFTLQGEGPYSGQPAVFVRLSKCNLACSFCDTTFEKGDWLTFSELDNVIDKAIRLHWERQGLPVPKVLDTPSKYYSGSGVGLVVTGGEPTLQPALDEWLINSYFRFDFVQVESNGLMYLPKARENVNVDWVISPKCQEVDGKPSHYSIPGEKVLACAMCLKFVISADPLSPYHTVPDWAFDWKRKTDRHIYVSPMNMYLRKPQRMIDSPENQSLRDRSVNDEVVSFWEEGLLDRNRNRANHEYAALYALNNRLILSLQTHLYASLP